MCRLSIRKTVLVAFSAASVAASTAHGGDAPTASPAGASPAQSAPGSGRFDLEAARRQVREMQFDALPQQRETGALSADIDPGRKRFRQKFDSGKRPDCLTAFQGAGILALVAMPLAILTDKKDHGCKW
jgi:hypothetical protein